MSDSVDIFEKLKKEVANTFLQENSVENIDISLWKGQEITSFQEDLFQKTKNSISEKWFYTYFKNKSEKLPRVDMLNILSIYVGYQNWADFKINNVEQIQDVGKKRKLYKWLLFSLGIVVLITILIYILLKPKTNEFQFCFIDENTNQSINSPVEVIVLREGESSFYALTDSNGCFNWKTKNDFIQLVIKSPYHKIDTIYRNIHDKGKEQVKLITDDYALMIHYYSTSNVKDWKKRRQHLQNIIAEDAKIYQVFKGNIGVEVYSKNEFVNKLTLPTKSLKNIDIVETKYDDDKIVLLKFVINKD